MTGASKSAKAGPEPDSEPRPSPRPNMKEFEWLTAHVRFYLWSGASPAAGMSGQVPLARSASTVRQEY